MTPAIRRYLPYILLAAMLVVALVAGGIGIALSRASSPSAPPPVLTWANEGTSDLLTLDPALGTDLNEHQAAQLIYGGLVRFGPGFEILPDEASSWEVTDGTRTYTFHLRPNIRFGNGHLLTAADIAFSLNRTLSPAFSNHSSAYLINDIVGAKAVLAGRARTAAGIQVLNPRTIRIHLVHGTGSFLSRLATPAGYIVDRLQVAANPSSWYRRAVGTGPFMVSRWVPGTGLLLVPNPYYWGGKLRIGGVDMPFIPEPLTAYKRYRAGLVDTMGTIAFPGTVLFDVRDRSDFHPSPRLETVYLTLNQHGTIFSRALVRQAFEHAIDKAALVSEVYGGFGQPTDGMLPPGIPGYSRTIPGTAYDPVEARRLLAQAGYPGGRGFPAVTYSSDQDAQSVALANAVAGQWQRTLGVQVTVQQNQHDHYLTILDQRRYQIAVIDWTADYPDPQNFLSQQLRTGSPNNNAGWSNARFDALVDRADGLPASNPERLRLYRRAEILAMDQAATIPLVNPNAAILLRTQIHGLTVDGGQLLARNWANVWIQRST